MSLPALIESLDQAVSHQETAQVVEGIRKILCECVRDDTVDLPGDCYEACSEHYARRLLHQSEEHGYSVVAMTWGPGQGTPIHDHSGLWCVEGIWSGEIEVLQYELLGVDGERYNFEQRGCMQACVGSAGSLIPPHEYHTIANATEQPAISIHVYGGDMKCCNTFAL